MIFKNHTLERLNFPGFYTIITLNKKKVKKVKCKMNYLEGKENGLQKAAY
jgi:hypothetical protein